MSEKIVPLALRRMFIAHFVVDIAFAIPLIFAPGWFVHFFDFPGTNFLFVRFLGATLVAIGGTSLLVRDAGRDIYSALLTLKILFSCSIIFCILLSLPEGLPILALFFLSGFALYAGIWIHYKMKI